MGGGRARGRGTGAGTGAGTGVQWLWVLAALEEHVEALSLAAPDPHHVMIASAGLAARALALVPRNPTVRRHATCGRAARAARVHCLAWACLWLALRAL